MPCLCGMQMRSNWPREREGSQEQPYWILRETSYDHIVFHCSSVFIDIIQSGYSATDARAIAERAVAAAEARSIAQHAEKDAERVAEIERQVAAEKTANEKEQKFYEYAFRMAE